MNEIQSLQHMLNLLSFNTPALPRITESGAFDESLLESVMIFQRDNGLPVTGVVDIQTWSAIRGEYYRHLDLYGFSPVLHIIPRRFPEELTESHLNMVKAALSELEQHISNLEFSGDLTRSLRVIQGLAALPVTGRLDRQTWAIIASLYRAVSTRQALYTSPLVR